MTDTVQDEQRSAVPRIGDWGGRYRVLVGRPLFLVPVVSDTTINRKRRRKKKGWKREEADRLGQIEVRYLAVGVLVARARFERVACGGINFFGGGEAVGRAAGGWEWTWTWTWTPGPKTHEKWE